MSKTNNKAAAAPCCPPDSLPPADTPKDYVPKGAFLCSSCCAPATTRTTRISIITTFLPVVKQHLQHNNIQTAAPFWSLQMSTAASRVDTSSSVTIFALLQAGGHVFLPDLFLETPVVPYGWTLNVACNGRTLKAPSRTISRSCYNRK